MSRTTIYILAMGLVSMAIIAVMIFGVGVALNYLLLGGLTDIYIGMESPGDGVLIIEGIAKVMCSGPAALLVILAIQECLNVIDRLRAWRVGRV